MSNIHNDLQVSSMHGKLLALDIVRRQQTTSENELTNQNKIEETHTEDQVQIMINKANQLVSQVPQL